MDDDPLERGSNERVAHPLAPYVPPIVADWLADSGDSTYRELDASAVFIDISGFTRLSEHLARRGRIGAEELSEAIGSCFAELLDIAHLWGGELLKFGGDAMFLLFRNREHEATAAAAAVAIRRALRTAGRVEVPGMRLSLRMTIGVESGRFRLFLVGESHRELIVAGPTTSAVVAAESAADTGEIIVGPGTARALRPSLVGGAKGPGWLLRRAPNLAPPDIKQHEHVDGDLALAVPAALRSHLSTRGHYAEHRVVSIAFIHFDDTDELITNEGVAVAARQLQQLVTVVQSAVDRRGVTFLGSDVDHNGGKIILAAGAPTSSEDDERRLLLALNDVRDAGLDLPVRIGINRGAVFAGDIGIPTRRTYTVMGDAVNLAARLMARADVGQLLAASDIMVNVADQFVEVPVEPFFVKGKERAVEAVRVEGIVSNHRRSRIAEPTTATPFVGREEELRILVGAAESVASGHGTTVQLLGPSGLGKSRLVDELHHRSPELERHTLLCHPYETTTPYFPFRHWLRDVLEIDDDASDAEAVRQLERAIERLAPALQPWAPLVAAVIDVPMAQTPESLQLEARFRAARLGAVVTELLARRLTAPTLLVVEDAHTIDDASAELLGHLARHARSAPWLVCITARDELARLGALGVDSTTVRLEPLPAADTTQLALVATEGNPLAPHEMAALTERAGGNPLFLTELISAHVAGQTELPDSLEALITARIDRLPSSDRALLRQAAVLGQSFPEAVLRAVVDDVPGPEDGFWDRVDGLLHRDGTEIVFAHTIVRDGAYASLPFRLRREIHALAADELRRRAGDHLDTSAELLSMHYFHAHRFGDAWLHANVAADRAAELYANREASELYERALECGRQLPFLAPPDLARLHEKLGDVRSRLASYPDAERAYRAARTCVKGDPVAEARLMLRIAWVIGWCDGYSRALRWITMGLRTIDGVESADASRQRTRLLAWYGQFCQQQGHHRRATKWCNIAVAEAEGSGQVDALAHALKVLGWAEMDLGQLDSAPHLWRSLELYEECGDLPGQASVHNLLGGYAYWRGEWGQALESYQRARDLARRIGDMVLDAFCAANIGEIALDQGRIAEAEELFGEAFRVWQAAGDRPGTTFAKCSLARVACRRGRVAEAMQLFDEAEQESEEVGAQLDALEARARRAEGMLLMGRPQAALELADEFIDRLGTQAGVMSHTPLVHRIRGAALLRTGDLAQARAAFDESLAAGRARQADYEVALTLELLAELGRRSGARDADGWRREATEILGRLEVLATPDLLGDTAAAADG